MTIIKAKISQENNNEEIKNLLIEFCEPKKHYYCFFDNERMYKDFCRTFSKTFNDDAPILKRCTKRITLVTNKDEQQDLIKNHHEGKTNHRGIRETYTRLQRLYYWPKLTLDVSNFINKCEICKKTKYERHPPEIPLKVTPKIDCPFQQLNIDLFTIEGKTFLTIIDAFTKLAQAYPIRSKNAIDISDTLIVYFSHYGIPEKITFDSGTEFQNDTVQKLLETHKIKIHFTPRHPQSNGLIERFHSTITEHYRILKQNFNDPPDKTMIYAILGYNNSIHSVTNLTPLELLFGHTSTRNPFDLYHNVRYFQQYHVDHKNRMKLIYNEMTKLMQMQKEKVINKRNAQPEQTTFKIGQTVFERNPLADRNKSKNRYLGPFIIESINNDNTCILKNQNNQRKKVHLDNLRPPVPGLSSHHPILPVN
ncbi:Retrovirus-related Pol polyprotein from transposon opus-like Protein [Tribolium castaneum]|uniref:RNA-directed DNA polymerase n=1 Tax=Tribolium castaneum TaxID=7070 RepID=D7EJ62_TRICA|nr:Retrovirus-related Pol polyprotein from transposon opus-like Protein [Tribolium castaneum]